MASFLKALRLPKIPFFQKRPTSLVGIEVGTYSTKIVQLRRERERAILETYGELLNAGYHAPEDQRTFLKQADNAVAGMVSDILREAGVSTRSAVFSAPVAASFVTSIRLPKMSLREINEAIPLEARKYVPIPLSEVLLDWNVTNAPDQDPSHMEVLLVAVPLQIVEKFQRVASLANLKLYALEIETFSTIRALIGTEATSTAIIDLGHQSTTVNIVDNGSLRMSRSVARGASALTAALERGLQVNNERAEAVKRQIGLSERAGEQEIVSLLTPHVETLLAEADRLIEVYNRRNPQKVQNIMLTGGGANISGIVEYAAQKFGIEVSRPNPFRRIVIPSFMEPTIREIGPSFSVAVGLALYQ